MTKQLTSEELKQKINNKENFVLDLFATWCGPCKIMLGNLEKVNESLMQKGTPKYGVYKFDIEQDMDLMKEWNVRGVPTIKIFIVEYFIETGQVSILIKADQKNN